MTAPTDQFVDIAKRSQEAVNTAVRSWADSVQNFAGHLGAGQGNLGQLPNPQNVVDTYFDFAEKVLANQRQLATQFVSASLQAGETVKGQAVKAAEHVTDQTVNGVDTAAQKAADATEATTEATVRAARATRNVVKG